MSQVSRLWRKVGYRTGLLLAAVAVAAATIALVAWQTDASERLELSTIDTRFDVRGERPSPKGLLVVDIDAKSLEKFGRWPFDRRHHAEAIRRLTDAGVRAIAYDVQFTEPSNRYDDGLLLDAVAGARGKLVLSTTEVDARGRSNVFGDDDLVRQLGARAANSIVPSDPGGVIRRFPLEVEGLKGFAVSTAEVATGRRIGESQLGGTHPYIDFPGPPGTVRHVSMADLVAGKVPKSELRDAVVVVGASAPRLKDVFATSSSGAEMMTGAEVIAASIGTVLDGVPLRHVSFGVDLLLLVLLAFAIPLAALRYGVRVTMPLAAALAVAFAGAAQLAFNSGWVVNVVFPLMALAIATAGTLAVQIVVAIMERERVRDIFSRFVADEVVGEVLAQTNGDLRLAVRMESTVLFGDLRGFTAFAETNPVETTLGVLNRYLTEMSDAILAHGGTLVAYMGDGIMAVFGAPISRADHADRAFAAACEMAGPRLAKFNAYMAEEGIGGAFAMGIGLNSGEVMSGNVGSMRRMEYTAIGDTTNTAARLEAMTKGSGFQIFLSDATRTLLSDPPADLVEMGVLEIRGRRDPLGVWAVR